MTDTPEFDQFKAELRNLRAHPLLKKLITRNHVHLGKLAVEDVAVLMLHEAAKYFLFAAAGLNRTTLKKAAKEPETAIVEKKLRQAYAIKRRLPGTAISTCAAFHYLPRRKCWRAKTISDRSCALGSSAYARR